MIPTRERDEFVYEMARAGMWLRDIPKMLRDAGTYQMYATFLCNRELTDYERQQWDRAKTRIVSLCALSSMTPVFNNDPRGACVKLQVPSGKTNDWGQIGICVPTRRY
jgi:hypothetical protein